MAREEGERSCAQAASAPRLPPARGLMVLTARTGNGQTSISDPAGIEIGIAERADPQFGMNAPLKTWSLSSGSKNLQIERGRDVFRADPNDPLSAITEIVEVTQINGRAFLSIYDVGARTLETTSPEGRSQSFAFNATDHLSGVTIPGLTPASFSYDARGRLTTIVQGTRTTTFGYDTANRLRTITDPLLRTVSFGYDAADRVTLQTLADGREIAFTYDAAGNLTSVTPPSRPSHAFTFTPVDLTDTYTPPTVPGGGATQYEYNLDKQNDAGDAARREDDRAGLRRSGTGELDRNRPRLDRADV